MAGNIALGRPGAYRAAIEGAARLAGACRAVIIPWAEIPAD